MDQVLESTFPEQLVEEKPAPQPKPESSRIRPHLVTGWVTILLGTWIGVVAGLIETVWYAVGRYAFGVFIFSGSNVYWLTPFVHCAVALIVSLPLVFLAHFRRQCSERLVVVLLVFLAMYNTALLIPNLHYTAELLLAGGVAMQLGHWLDKHPGRFLQMVRSSIAYPVLTVALIWVATELLPSGLESQAMASLPAPDEGSPNVLLIVLDTVRSDAITLTGDPGQSRTPHLHRLAREGVVFLQAHSTSPWTLPSHASMFTSRLPHELSSGWYNGLDNEFPTIAEWLRDRGYRTGGFVGNTIYCSSETGLNRGFVHYEDYVLSLKQLLLSSAWVRHLVHNTTLPLRLGSCDSLARRRAPAIRKSLLQWLDTSGRDHPYFVMVNLFDAHDPYVAPAKFQRFTPANNEERGQLRYWWEADKELVTEDQAKRQQTAYEDCIAHLDDQVGQLIDELRMRGDLDNTLVIITADHGEHFGDHNLYGHGNSLYEASIHVPLILWSKQLKAQKGVSKSVVSTRDLPATIAKFVAPEATHPFVGDSILKLAGDGDGEVRQTAPVFSQIAAPSQFPACGGRSPVFRGSMRSVIHGGLKYIRNGDGLEEVYDITHDPLEVDDLVETLMNGRLEELRKLVDGQFPG